MPMKPIGATEDYLCMDGSNTNSQHITGGLSSAASSCSVTSGTPSTDSRFAEYHLDKVVSRFTPDDEDTTYVLLGFFFFF